MAAGAEPCRLHGVLRHGVRLAHDHCGPVHLGRGGWDPTVRSRARAARQVQEVEAGQHTHNAEGGSDSLEDRVGTAGYSCRGQLEALAHVHSLVAQNAHCRGGILTALDRCILHVRGYSGRLLPGMELIQSNVAHWEAKSWDKLDHTVEALRMQAAAAGHIGQFVHMVEGHSSGGSSQQTTVAVRGDGDGAGCDRARTATAAAAAGTKQAEVEKWHNEPAAADPGTAAVWRSHSEQEVMHGTLLVHHSAHRVLVHVVHRHDCCPAEDKGRLGDHILKGSQRAEAVEGRSRRTTCSPVLARRERAQDKDEVFDNGSA